MLLLLHLFEQFFCQVQSILRLTQQILQVSKRGAQLYLLQHPFLQTQTLVQLDLSVPAIEIVDSEGHLASEQTAYLVQVSQHHENLVLEVGQFLPQVAVQRKLSAQQEDGEPYCIGSSLSIEEELEISPLVGHFQQVPHFWWQLLGIPLPVLQIEDSHLLDQFDCQFYFLVSSTPHGFVEYLGRLSFQLKGQGLAQVQSDEPEVEMGLKVFYPSPVVVQVLQHLHQGFSVELEHSWMIGVDEFPDFCSEPFDPSVFEEHRVVVQDSEEETGQGWEGASEVGRDLHDFFDGKVKFVDVKDNSLFVFYFDGYVGESGEAGKDIFADLEMARSSYHLGQGQKVEMSELGVRDEFEDVLSEEGQVEGFQAVEMLSYDVLFAFEVSVVVDDQSEEHLVDHFSVDAELLQGRVYLIVVLTFLLDHLQALVQQLNHYLTVIFHEFLNSLGVQGLSLPTQAN